MTGEGRLETDNMVKNEKRRKETKKVKTVQKWNWVTCVLVFLFMLYLNISVRYCTDDWHFKFVFYGFMPEAGVRRMRTFQDVLFSAWNYYRLSGGRILAHGLTFFLLLADQWVFDVVNAGMFVALGLLIYHLVPDRGWRTHSFSLPFIFFSIFYFSLSFGDSAVWLSGSVNYLWTGVLNLLAIYLFRKYMKEQPCKWGHLVLLAFLMFLAGQSNETTGGMLLILLVLYGLSLWRERTINWRLYAASVPAILCGMAVVLLAPGNRNRAREIHDMETTGFAEIRDSILTYIIDLSSQTWPILLLCLFVFLLQARKGSLLRVFCAQRFFWAGVAGTAALGLAGVMIPRGTFLPVVYLILAGCDSAEYLLEKWGKITGEGRWEEMLEKRRLTGTVLRLIASLLCLEAVYLLCVLCKEEAAFTENDLLFLTRGLGFMALSVIALILPNKTGWLERVRRYGKKLLILGVLFFGIFYFAANMISFQENKNKLWTVEEQARRAASAGEGEFAVVSFPMYQESDFWPRESGCSHEYTGAWMKEFFQSEKGGL